MAEVTIEDVSKVYHKDIAVVRDMSLVIEDWESSRHSRRSSAMAAVNASASFRSGRLNAVLFYVVLVDFALPLTVVIPSFAAVYKVDYGAQAAAAVVVTIPLVVVVLIFQRGVVAGLTAGTVEE